MAAATKSAALTPAGSHPNNHPELQRLLAESAQLQTEGQSLRAKAKRLRLDCVKARLELAESLARFADANRGSARMATLFRNKALETYANIRESISHPGWTGMERQALEGRLARLRSLLVDLRFCEPDAVVQCRPAEGQSSKTLAATHSNGKVTGNECTADPLTRRELDVLKCLAEGHSTKEIAAMLGISFKTAACHRYRIMEKVGMHNTAMLVRFAIRIGLVRP